VRGGFPEAQRILSSCHFGCSSSHCAARRCPRHTQAANPDQPSSASDLNVWQVIGLPHQTEDQRKVTSIIGSAKTRCRYPVDAPIKPVIRKTLELPRV